MRFARRSAVLLAAMLLSNTLFAAEITGKWKGPMQSGGDAVFDLKSEKGTVTGNMLGYDGKPYPVSEGKLEDENISMKVAFEWQGQPVTLLVTGKVSGEDMQLHIASDNGYWSTDAALKRQK
jgi:hypothetical protein